MRGLWAQRDFTFDDSIYAIDGANDRQDRRSHRTEPNGELMPE
jgi:hypothetical protein